MFTLKSIIGIIAFAFIAIYVVYAIYRIRKVAIQKELVLEKVKQVKLQHPTKVKESTNTANLEKIYFRAIELTVKTDHKIKSREPKGKLQFHREFEYDLN